MTETQTETPSVHVLLAHVMQEVDAVAKKERNQQQNYNFRGVDAVVNAVAPAFRKFGIVPAPHAVESHYRDVKTSSGKDSRECTVTVTYRFYGPRGDYVQVQVPGESMDFSDKGAPKSMSVAYRIALLQLLCIPTDEPDPDAVAYQRGGEYQARTAEEQTNGANIQQQIKVTIEALRQGGVENIDSKVADYVTVRLGYTDGYDEQRKDLRWEQIRPAHLSMLLSDLRKKLRELKAAEEL